MVICLVIDNGAAVTASSATETVPADGTINESICLNLFLRNYIGYLISILSFTWCFNYALAITKNYRM